MNTLKRTFVLQFVRGRVYHQIECFDNRNNDRGRDAPLREQLRLPPWYYTSVYSISRIRINCRDYDRWSRSYFAIFLSGASPREMQQIAASYLWPPYAHFVPSRHFWRLGVHRYSSNPVILMHASFKAPLSSRHPFKSQFLRSQNFLSWLEMQ